MASRSVRLNRIARIVLFLSLLSHSFSIPQPPFNTSSAESNNGTLGLADFQCQSVSGTELLPEYDTYLSAINAMSFAAMSDYTAPLSPNFIVYRNVLLAYAGENLWESLSPSYLLQTLYYSIEAYAVGRFLSTTFVCTTGPNQDIVSSISYTLNNVAKPDNSTSTTQNATTQLIPATKQQRPTNSTTTPDQICPGPHLQKSNSLDRNTCFLYSYIGTGFISHGDYFLALAKVFLAVAPYASQTPVQDDFSFTTKGITASIYRNETAAQLPSALTLRDINNMMGVAAGRPVEDEAGEDFRPGYFREISVSVYYVVGYSEAHWLGDLEVKRGRGRGDAGECYAGAGRDFLAASRARY
ncbi:uncharacterized protein KY384_001794 [Bacidia gigantensis]|uniref:uncharacterized protein n=1 Tax=Bacidia gigantensis TaxID=2732470 RepID=UPI001D04CCCC|nr:uncharacterized protein KY384_001794 [Bacidia gigantensis]KAG8533012.1 hypothetical protein KY384_001794 [Bacidia gigantensis]